MAESLVVKILRQAMREKYAVPAFNVYNIETINAVTQAAEELESPLILALSPATVRHIGMRLVATLVRDISWRSTVPVALHLDHGHNPEFIRQCIQAGFDSVMIDESTEDIATNIRNTREIVNQARGRGNVAVEAELGCVGGFNVATNTLISDDWLTDPDAVADFVNKTGIDCLAVAIGTQHGPYRTTPKLDIERLRKIRQQVRIPLVLHGASGLLDRQIKEVIEAGISKINIATELKTAFTDAVRKYLMVHTSESDMRWYLQAGQKAVNEVAKQKIKLFGSAGKSRSV